MAKFSIIPKGGGTARYSGCPTFTGTYLKPGMLEFREIASPTAIDWEVGDYVAYTRTGFTYRLYSIPQVKKQARPTMYGGAFVYQSVQFFDDSKQLEICPFRDLVPDDNRIHFSTQPAIAVFDDVAGIAERLQVCLEDMYGAGSWVVRVATRTEVYNAYVAMGYSTTDAGAKADEYDNLVTEDRDFSVSGVNILQCFEKIYEVWPEVGWVYKVESNKNTIVIGGAGLVNTDSYQYGKGNGLKSITRTVANADEMATRIFAYGSSRNMLPRWYNNQTIKDADSVDIQNLMIPVSEWGETLDNGTLKPDPAKAYIDADSDTMQRLGLRPKTYYFDGSGDLPDIYPSIRQMTIKMVREALNPSGATPLPKYYPSTSVYTNENQRVDVLKSAQATFDSGKEATDGKSATATDYADISKTSTGSVSGGGQHRESIFSKSITATETGRMNISASFDLSGTIEADLAGAFVLITISKNGSRIFERNIALEETAPGEFSFAAALASVQKIPVTSGDTISCQLTAILSNSGSSAASFSYSVSGSYSLKMSLYRDTKFVVTINQIGFDINEQAALGEGKTIAMRSGKCAGRSFVIAAVQYNDATDDWTLECVRSEDESLSQWFPNYDYPILAGDEFVLLDIAMPDEYILVAEQRLLEAAQDLLADVSVERWQYTPDIDAKFMVENSRVLLPAQNMVLSDADIIGEGPVSVLIDSVTIAEGEAAIPTYKVTLRDRKKKTFTESKGSDNISSKPVTSSSSNTTPASSSSSGGGESLWTLDEHGNVTLKSQYQNLWVPGWLAAGGVGSGGGGGGGTDLNRVWESLTNNTDFPDTKINLAHIPDLPYAKVTGLDSWIASKGYLLPTSLKTVNGNSLVGSGDITIADGQDGQDGKSAYQIWLDEGNVGTEQDFLASLKGDPGSSQAYPFSLVSGFVGGNDVAPTAEDVKQLKLQHDALAEKVVPPPVDALPYDLVKVNLFDPDDVTTGYYIDSNGNLVSTQADYLVTGYIPFTPSMGKLTLSVAGNSVLGSGGNIAFYDADKNFLGTHYEGTGGGTVEWDDKVAFARFSVPYASNGRIQIEVGDTITSYLEPGVHLIKDSALIPGSTLDNATVSGDKLAPGAVSPEKCDFFKVNLYDQDEAVFDYFLDSNGNLYGNNNWMVTGYIPFTSGKMCASANGDPADGGGHIVLYDRDKRIVGNPIMSSTTHNVATWQAGVAYVRFSLVAEQTDQIQVELGDTITSYIAPGEYALDPNIKVTSELPDGAVTTPKIANASVTPQKCTFFKYNLFDPNDEDVEPGMFLYGDGSLHENSSYITTGFIPFSSGKLCISVNGQSGAGGGYVVLFGPDKTTVINSYSGSSCNNVATWEEGVAYVRFSPSGYTGSGDQIQVEPGDTITDYMPYGEAALDQQYSHDKQQYESLLGEDAGRASAASLTNGQYLVISGFPYYIKKGVCLSMHADVTSFNTIYFGKGYSSAQGGLYYCGQWLKIDNTNVTVQLRYESTSEPATVQHGLTISGFIRVSMSLDNHGTIHIVINTVSGMFQHDFEYMTFDMANSPFVMSYGSTLANVKLNATCMDFRCPVWAFGDSYFGVNRGRWPGWMKEFGYFNFMLDGLPGIGSRDMIDEVNRALAFGTPKYILWMLGMNDADVAYEYNFNEIKAICQRKGITLILATVPTVPTRSKEYISSLVRSSGYRYIDCYKAVGADSSGNWYPGFLDVDGVHPDIKGAQAIATQVLVDFPELMQYGLSS